MDIKKLILREALIPIGILIVFLFLTVLSKQIDPPVGVMSLSGDFEGSPKVDADIITNILNLRAKYPQYNKLTNMELVDIFSKDYPQSVSKIRQIIKDERDNLKDSSVSKLAKQIYKISLWVVIFIYPVYLLIRLILWLAREYGSGISALLPFKRKYIISIVVAITYVFIIQLIFRQSPQTIKENIIISLIGLFMATIICVCFWDD